MKYKLLNLKRTLQTELYTEGSLFINGEYFCDTLELYNSGISYKDNTSKIKQLKIERKICIPYGTYQIVINYSPRFKRMLPLLLNVPGFSGIRLHAGNTVKDSEGCILVGIKTKDGYITKSKDTLEKLINVIKDSNCSITIQ